MTVTEILASLAKSTDSKQMKKKTTQPIRKMQGVFIIYSRLQKGILQFCCFWFSTTHQGPEFLESGFLQKLPSKSGYSVRVQSKHFSPDAVTDWNPRYSVPASVIRHSG